jgi:pimeloyl-ACP methyl ester carboxylesterase
MCGGRSYLFAPGVPPHGLLGYWAEMGVSVPYLPPLWRESRFALEAAALFRSPVWRGEGVEPGEGRPVLLVPGFLAGDRTLGLMAQWLRSNGYRTRRAGIRANVGCSEEACGRLEERLEALAERTGRPVALIGQSRGGVLVRALAARRPELVSCVVTLGAPTVSQLRVHPVVLVPVGVLGALGTGRVPGLFSLRCLRGACCAPFRAGLRTPLPPDIEYVAIYSRSDGIVDWRACLATGARHVEVDTSHLGMALNAAVYREIARALAGEPALAEAA